MRTAFAAAGFVLLAASARAQQPQMAPPVQDQPISGVVVDLRGVFARHKQEPSVATDLGVIPANLPTHSWGLAAGAQFYPLHAGKVALGLGGHTVMAKGSKTLEPTATTSDGTTVSADLPTVERHFGVYAADVSINLGHRNGWSFIGGGIGTAKMYSDVVGAAAESVPRRQVIHYGGGARWFTNHHVAVSLEFRWYSVAPLEAGPTYVAQPRTTLLVLSGGIALR